VTEVAVVDSEEAAVDSAVETVVVSEAEEAATEVAVVDSEEAVEDSAEDQESVEELKF
jgi:hypothetical protein